MEASASAAIPSVVSSSWRGRNPTKTGKPDASSWARELSIEDRRSFGDLARRLAGWAPAMPWWAQSHDHVIKSFLDEPVPERPVDIETRACTAVGDEFYARLNSGDTGAGAGPVASRPRRGDRSPAAGGDRVRGRRLAPAGGVPAGPGGHRART